MRYIIILVMLALLFHAQSCCMVEAAPDKWQTIAIDLYRYSSQDRVCRHRCAILGKYMMEDGQPFDWDSVRPAGRVKDMSG